jgi:hypothetical protein
MSRTSKAKKHLRLAGLGPSSFSVSLASEPKIGTGGGAVQEEFEPVGLLAELATAHRRGWQGRWKLQIGELHFPLDLSPDSGQLEEFWVFLLELTDADGGEWTLSSGGELLTLEGQVHGPDVILDFATEDEAGRFGGAVLPRKATVRLRALVCSGTAFFRSFLKESCRLAPGMNGRPDLLGFYEDLDALEASVSDLPGTFRSKDDS